MGKRQGSVLSVGFAGQMEKWLQLCCGFYYKINAENAEEIPNQREFFMV